MDLNLLFALDVLLAEGSVSRAAKRMNVSVPAMSRTLARIRDVVGDPILVRAGRELVPTARAEALRERVRAVLDEARGLLTEEQLDVAGMRRAFVIRSADAIVGAVGAQLCAALRAEAKGVTVTFVPEGDEGIEPLRDGSIDLDVGVAGDIGPELRLQALATGPVFGLVRRGHPLASGEVTMARYCEHPHVGVSRRGKVQGPIDVELRRHGFTRTVALVAPGFYVALQLIAGSDLVGHVAAWMPRVALERLELVTFPLPVDAPPITISQTWHPRADADPAHRWLREQMRAVWKGRDTRDTVPPPRRAPA